MMLQSYALVNNELIILNSPLQRYSGMMYYSNNCAAAESWKQGSV